MKSNTYKLVILSCALGFPGVANAFEFSSGKFDFNINGYGTAGLIEPDFDEPKFLDDWRVRTQVKYNASRQTVIGGVYSLDAKSYDDRFYVRDGFGFLQLKNIGRLELGITDSVARKLGVGLPDVSGLRLNDSPLFYKKIKPDGSVISDTLISSGNRALRANLVSRQINDTQYGLSVAGLNDNYDYAIDGGIKIKFPNGKTKTALSIGTSFINKPDDYQTQSYTPRLTADWRAQLSGGLNLQYNSFIWGITGRLIYDKNPIGELSDGFVAGTGISYDILNYTVSVSYLLSETGIWNQDIPNYVDNTGLMSVRYKYSENLGVWTSVGITSKTPFVSAGLKLTF